MKPDKIMYKLLSKNVTECIEQDLYWRGYNYVKEVYNQMTCMYTKNREYKMSFIRQEAFQEGLDFQYICSWRFQNNLGIEVLDLRFNEIMALNIFDSISAFLEFNMADIIIPLTQGNTNLVNYQLTLNNNQDVVTCTILQYNPHQEMMIPRLIFYLDWDEVSELVYNMYFSYYIDIDNGAAIDSVYGIVAERAYPTED